MSIASSTDHGLDPRLMRIRAVALTQPRRPVWISELLAATHLAPRSDALAQEDVVAAITEMHERGELTAAIKDDVLGWVPAPADSLALASHVEDALDALGRAPVKGEVLVLLARGGRRGTLRAARR